MHVALKGTAPSSVDVYTSDCFVKVNFSPYLLALDLCRKINYENTVARFDQRDGTLLLKLPKETPGEWESLTFQVSEKLGDKKIRNQGVDKGWKLNKLIRIKLKRKKWRR